MGEGIAYECQDLEDTPAGKQNLANHRGKLDAELQSRERIGRSVDERLGLLHERSVAYRQD